MVTLGQPLSVPDEVPGLKYYGMALAILLGLCLLYAGMLVRTDPSLTACRELDRLTSQDLSTVQLAQERRRLSGECNRGD